ncbi:metallophosphoesterase family protein [Martelella mediterranea]|uniref:Putative phosphoesterase n=1 Tax=Martelella mediterranea TaxID=293089 RepID=A0A4R3NXC6_9HYPH|nr:metallophosphoesterase family protein [Martelella mediterranea]TCT37616.1 putative phosphoesterase [Martelella mediterranea]
MKIAAIADIHGNVDALDAVLADIERHQPDLIVNLGDSFSSPLLAGETAERLMPLDLPTVRGNHDRALVDRPFEAMGDWEQPAYRQLSDEHLQWVRDMPAALVVANDVYLCHATPASDQVMWTETLLETGQFTLRPLAEIEAEAEGVNYPLMLCGHSHIARSVWLSDGRLIVNPGSVGCPGFSYFLPFDHKLETATPFAAYATIEKTERGWQPSFHQVPYDTRRSVALARESGMKDWESALSTGWV